MLLEDCHLVVGLDNLCPACDAPEGLAPDEAREKTGTRVSARRHRGSRRLDQGRRMGMGPETRACLKGRLRRMHRGYRASFRAKPTGPQPVMAFFAGGPRSESRRP